MHRLIYKFIVKPGKQATFGKSWTELTYIACAQWPDKGTLESAKGTSTIQSEYQSTSQ
ncbi:MAG: hypothetical protein ACI9G9_000904 [Psychromonas sp.]|jgi:hypothetical protein